jgi:hypothetical protein
MIFEVTLSTPKGEGVMEVPTALGESAARHRAVFTACAAGWGDLDEIEIVRCEKIDDGFRDMTA